MTYGDLVEIKYLISNCERLHKEIIAGITKENEMSELKLEVGATYVFKDEISKEIWLRRLSVNSDLFYELYRDGFTLTRVNELGFGIINSSIVLLPSELKYFKLKEESKMQDNVFTKDMLVAGKHICELRNGSKYMVMISDEGLFMSDPSTTCEYMSLEVYDDKLKRTSFSTPTKWDIVKIYTTVRSNNFRNWNQLNLIWERKELTPTQIKLNELEETIKKAQQQIQSLKGEQNV